MSREPERVLPCPCGGEAWSRDECNARLGDGTPDSEWFWHSVMGADSYYCPDEDDVLTDHEVATARVAARSQHTPADPQ